MAILPFPFSKHSSLSAEEAIKLVPVLSYFPGSNSAHGTYRNHAFDICRMDKLHNKFKHPSICLEDSWALLVWTCHDENIPSFIGTYNDTYTLDMIICESVLCIRNIYEAAQETNKLGAEKILERTSH